MILAVAIVALTFVYRSFDQQATSSLQLEANRKAEIVSHLLEESIRIGDYNGVLQVASRLLEDETIASVKVEDGFNETIIDTQKPNQKPAFVTTTTIGSDGTPIGTIRIGFRFNYFENLALDFKVKVFTIVFFLLVFIGLISVGLLTFFQGFFRELSEAFSNIAVGIPYRLSTKRVFSDLASIAQTFNETSAKLSEVKDLEIQKAKINAMADIAAQVAHDIRSPLAAIATVEKDLREIPEERRVILRSAINRIRDIASDLLEKNKPSKRANAEKDVLAPQLLSALVEQLLSEKRLQYRTRHNIAIHFHLNRESYGLFAAVHPKELKRVISNLVNNAIESISDSGNVDLYLKPTGGFVDISITDNGCGIPADLIPRLGFKGETHGKSEGQGLGLSHARTWVSLWGGDLLIDSNVGEGTKVTIRLPISPTPEWFLDKLYLRSTIVILDDDPSIHQIWRGRFASSAPEFERLSIFNFATTQELHRWCHENPVLMKQALFLLDFELLGSDQNGLDVANSLDISDRSVLVTSRFEEQKIRERCLRLGMKLIPKGLAGFVPIVVEVEDFSAILIDDDELVHMTWQTIASEKQKRILTFNGPDTFFDEAERFDRSTPVYVDYHLGGGKSGIDVCLQLRKTGFKNIYITTGSDVEFPELPWLRGITGKEPPL